MNPDLAAKLWIPFNATYGLLSIYVTISVSYALEAQPESRFRLA